MELQPLRYAVLLAQELHFGKAAQRANVTQPTLSQGIKKLEGELGAVLFERARRGVRLTASGKRFLPKIVPVLDRLAGAVDSLKGEAREASGPIRVGVIPTLCPYLMPGVVMELKKSAPKISLAIHEETTSVLVDHLKSGQLDLGVLALPIVERGVSTLSICKETFYLAVPRRHRLAGKKRVTPEEVARERVLILQEGHCFRRQSLAYCKLSARDPRVIFQGSSLSSVLNLTAAGEGVTFAPRMAADHRLYPGIRFVRFADPEPARELGIIWRSTSAWSRAHEAVTDAVKKVLRERAAG
ncbi:MAG: hydrogen peroxide-inducible genes activator [Candidatus Omnitrophica bacterium]|nr:hydrogen peroxide-inducible genes activator [Candidatus Omnitrophota bacterium]